MTCCHLSGIFVSTYYICTSSSSKRLRPPRQNPISWTALIFQHVKCGESRKALRIYEEMRQGGVKLSSYTFVAALKACSTLKDLENARHIHAQVVASRLELDVYVGTMLVDVYIKCGSLVDARSVFETMLYRDVAPWNAMIMGYAQRNEAEVALQLFARMKQEGMVPNDRTFVSVLKACSSLVARKEGCNGEGTLVRQLCLEHLRAIHSDVVKRGFDSNLFVGNMLVDAYSKCGSLVDARHVFESMPQRDVITWNAMILALANMGDGDGALQLYARMHEDGVVADDRTFVAALKACSSNLATVEARDDADVTILKHRCMEQLKRIHSELVKHGSESDVFVATMLVDVYARCGSLESARDVFEKMPHRDVVSWNAMIFGYVQVEMGEEALRLYTRMQGERVVPNERTLVGALRAYGNLVEGNRSYGEHVKKRWVEDVRALQVHMMKTGCKIDVFLGNILVNVYVKCRSMVDARCVFESIPHPNLVSWTAMILGYAEVGEGEVALQIYRQMQHEGVLPDSRTFVAVLKACRSMVALDDGKKGDVSLSESLCMEQVGVIHLDIVKGGFEADVYVGTMLVDVYAKCGSLSKARHVFKNMPIRNVVSWTAMIIGYAQMDEGEEALRLYSLMQQESVAPNGRTFLGALKACGSVAGLEKGKEIHAQIYNSGVELTSPFVASALIDMYCRCGSMADAQQVFDALHTKNIVTWSALIAGYARTGDSEAVFNSFETMRQEGIQPDGITFLSILTVCSHLGLLYEGQKYFEAMRIDFGVSPTIEHYTCMVDLLGRAGHLDEAVEMVRKMPFQPDGAVWESVLGACQKWSQADLGLQAFESAVGLDKEDAAPYALMSNIYAATHMWEELKDMDAKEGQKRACKQPGQSWWTDYGGAVHAFLVEDGQHPESHQIYVNLESLFVMMGR